MKKVEGTCIVRQQNYQKKHNRYYLISFFFLLQESPSRSLSPNRTCKMDLNDPNRFLNRNLYLRERFFGVSSHGQGSKILPPVRRPRAPKTKTYSKMMSFSPIMTITTTKKTLPNPLLPLLQFRTTTTHSHNHKAFAFGLPDVSLGIRAALPENGHPSPMVHTSSNTKYPSISPPFPPTPRGSFR